MEAVVIVAIINTTGLVAVGALQVLTHRRAAAAERHVRPNGHGNLPEMTERILIKQGELNGALKQHIRDRRAQR
jgi:hypothetical protein